MSGGMFDDLIPKPAAGGMFDDLIPQAGGTDVPAMARAPGSMGTSEEPGFLARQGRNLMLGAQAVGHGIADIATTPFNLANMGANVLLTGADMVADKAFGGRVPFRFNSQLDEKVAGAAESAVNAAGIPTFTPESTGEKVLYNATRFGTQGAVGGGGMAAGAKVADITNRTKAVPFVDHLLRPYAAAPVSTIAGDAAAGAGAGAALAGSQMIPEEYRSMAGGTVGGIADLLAMLGGGVAGGTLKEAVTGAPVSLFRAFRNSFTDRNLPVDPPTNIPFTRGQAERAAKDLQGAATDPTQAAKTIGDKTQYFRENDLPVPTSGLMSDDIGLIGVEQGQRRSQSTRQMVNGPAAPPEVKQKFNFGERDQALQEAAVGQVEGLIPAGSNPRAFTERAAEVAAAQRDQAQRGVDQATGRERGVEIARQAPAADLQAMEGQGTAASVGIDRMARETRNAEVQQKNALYNNPELTAAEVPVDPMRQTAGELGAADTPAAPLAPVVRKYVDRFGAIDEGTPITMREVNANRAEIEADIATNLDNGEIVRQLREMKATVNRYADELAATDGPAAEAAAAANANYRERFQPNFRQGAGGQFDRALKTERAGGTPVRPSETAETFLTSPEGTADLMRIAALRGNEQATAQQARTWLFDQLARKGVARDGAIDADAITRWRNVNEPVLANVPGLRDEVNGMVAAARRGETLSEQAAAAVRAAEARAAATETNISRSGVGMAEGKAPSQAVDSVLSAPDPRRAMRDLVSTVGRNAPALAGLKNAVATRLIERVTTALGDRLGQRAKKVFDSNREALAEVYTPEEMNRLQRAQKLVEPLDNLKVQATSGSATAERNDRWLPLEVIAKLRYGMLKGGGIVSNFKKTVGALTQGEDEVITRLKLLATFDPEAAQHLLAMKTAPPSSPGYNAALQKLIRRNEVLGNVTDPRDDKTDNSFIVPKGERQPLEITIRGRKPDGEQQK